MVFRIFPPAFMLAVDQLHADDEWSICCVATEAKSVLFLGRPGVGKTTVIREMARVLADDLKRRVVIVDTSNEIGGDGDVPHPAIGGARRMQVPDPSQQHRVMVGARLPAQAGLGRGSVAACDPTDCCCLCMHHIQSLSWHRGIAQRLCSVKQACRMGASGRLGRFAFQQQH